MLNSFDLSVATIDRLILDNQCVVEFYRVYGKEPVFISCGYSNPNSIKTVVDTYNVDAHSQRNNDQLVEVINVLRHRPLDCAVFDTYSFDREYYLSPDDKDYVILLIRSCYDTYYKPNEWVDVVDLKEFG